MALKSGLFGCMRSALGIAQPILSKAPIAALSQKCHLWNLKTLPTVPESTTGYESSNWNVFKNQLTLSSNSSLLTTVHIRNYHSVLRPRLHCKGCYFVWRHGRKYVECSDMPSHKQMKKLPTRKLWKEDYTKGNVRKAMMWNRDMARVSDRMCNKDVLSHNWLASRIGRDV